MTANIAYQSSDGLTIRPFNKATGVSDGPGHTVQKALEEGRRHFGVAAASLTWMHSPELKNNLPEGWKPEVLDLALKAEQDTSKTLLDWMKDKPNVVLMDSLHIRGAGKEVVDPETGLVEAGDTDHIMVIGDYILIIDTKRWKEKARYTVGKDGGVERNGKPFPGGNVHIEKAVHMWFNYVDCQTAEATGLVYINNGDEETTNVFRNDQWWKHYWFLLEPKRFKKWMDDKYAELVEKGKDKFIDSELVSQIAVCCVKPYNPRTGLINMTAWGNKF